MLTMWIGLGTMDDGSRVVDAVLSAQIGEWRARGREDGRSVLAGSDPSSERARIAAAMDDAISMVIGRALRDGADPEALRRIAAVPGDADASIGRVLLEAPKRCLEWSTEI